MKKIAIIASAIAALTSMEASAGTLLYRGSNPRITPTANPYNAGNLDKQAELSRPKERRASSSSAFSQLSEADLLKRSVISSLASRYQQILTNANSADGTINFGDGTFADYITVGGTRFITFRDTIAGTTTEISFPL